MFWQLPYRSRLSPAAINFTDTASWRANNCVAVNTTNGADVYPSTSSSPTTPSPNSPLTKFQQQPSTLEQVARKQLLNVILDTAPLSNVVLPPPLQPTLPLVNGSRSVSQFYMLKDGKTGVLALGSFADTDLNTLSLGMLQGLTSLKASGATQLIVELVKSVLSSWLYFFSKKKTCSLTTVE